MLKMSNIKTRVQEKEWTPKKPFLPFLFNNDDLEPKQAKKVELFEKGLEKELTKADTIEGAIIKIVRMALAAEFGASLVKTPGASGMVKTIVAGIMSDPMLRKQALIIVDRFAK